MRLSIILYDITTRYFQMTPEMLITNAHVTYLLHEYLGATLDMANIASGRYLIENLTSVWLPEIPDHFKRPNSEQLLIEMKELHSVTIEMGDTNEQAYLNAGKHLAERMKDSILDIENSQSSPSHTQSNIKSNNKRELLPSFEKHSSKKHQASQEQHTENYASEYMPEMDGRDFNWVQDDKDKIYQDAHLSRLSSNEEHIDLLKKVFRDTSNFIAIATYGISIDILNDLRDDILRLSSRGAGIHIYNSDNKPASQDVLAFMSKYNIRYLQLNSHVKFLFSDNRITAVGSYNWLSSAPCRYKDAVNGTIVSQDNDFCSAFGSQVLVFMRQYIYRKEKNKHLLNLYDGLGSANIPISYPIGFDNKITYLPTLDAHRDFIAASLRLARSSIYISCPFINSISGFLEDLSAINLKKTADRGVKITIMCQYSDVNAFHRSYRSLLKTHPNIELLPINQLHQKTIVIDSTLICEGSFNWTSASRNEAGIFHNNELSLVCEGPHAQPLIKAFYVSTGIEPKEIAGNNERNAIRLKR